MRMSWFQAYPACPTLILTPGLVKSLHRSPQHLSLKIIERLFHYLLIYDKYYILTSVQETQQIFYGIGIEVW